MKRLALLTLALLAALAPVAPAQTGAGLSIRLVDAPSDRRDDPRARIYVVDHLQPGDHIERRVELANGTGQPLDITLYAAAARVEEGQFQFGDGHAANELTRWTSVAPGQVAVPAGGTATATVEVDVPADAVDGERYAVVWAELPASGGTTSVVNRVGIRMYVSVGDGQEPVTDFEIDTLTAARDDDGRPVVRTAVRNTGGRAVDLGGELRLEDGPGGSTAGPFDVELGTTLAPGDEAPAVAHLPEDLPAGPWKATVSIRSGEVVREAEATITFPTSAGKAAKPVRAESVEQQRRILIPIAAVLAAVVLAGLAASAVRLKRKRR